MIDLLRSMKLPRRWRARTSTDPWTWEPDLRLAWFRGASRDERVAWFYGRALDILDLGSIALVAEKPVNDEWHAWLVRCPDGLAEFGAPVGYPHGHAFDRFRFLDVPSEHDAAYARIWRRPFDTPLADEEERAVIEAQIVAQRRLVDAGEVPYWVDLGPGTSATVNSLGFDPRRVTVRGWPPGMGRLEPRWERGCRPEVVCGASVQGFVTDRTVDSVENERAATNLRANVERLERLLSRGD